MRVVILRTNNIRLQSVMKNKLSLDELEEFHKGAIRLVFQSFSSVLISYSEKTEDVYFKGIEFIYTIATTAGVIAGFGFSN